MKTSIKVCIALFLIIEGAYFFIRWKENHGLLSSHELVYVLRNVCGFSMRSSDQIVHHAQVHRGQLGRVGEMYVLQLTTRRRQQLLEQFQRMTGVSKLRDNFSRTVNKLGDSDINDGVCEFFPLPDTEAMPEWWPICHPVEKFDYKEFQYWTVFLSKDLPETDSGGRIDFFIPKEGEKIFVYVYLH